MRLPALLLPALCCLSLSAQRQVRITGPISLDNAPDVRKARNAEAGLAAAGIVPDQLELVNRYGDRSYWPFGLLDDSARVANVPYIQNYTAFRLCSYQVDSLPMAIIMVPARDNIHMPEEMRPLVDLYMALPEMALTDVDNGRTRPMISRGPRWKDLPTAEITKPDDLYATYALAADSVALKALERAAMSPAEIDAVVFRSIETNWPVGINTFDRRYPHIEKFKKYKAYLAAEWGDKVLLIVPWDKNKGMPTVMRPAMDLYFVYNKAAVKSRGRRK